MGRALLGILLLALAASITAPSGVSKSIESSPIGGGHQANADKDFNASVARPAYRKLHPKVLYDEAHGNSYTSHGIYKPFADLITNDGYKVVSNTRAISKKSLIGYDVLVVVNSAGPGEHRDSSPFTDGECDAVRSWVNAGGALFLITDQAPFSTAIAKLSGRFGLSFTNGYTIETAQYNKDTGEQSELVFSRENLLLGEHPITRGRDSTERINRIISFSGTSLKGPPGSVPFLKLADTAQDVLPPVKKPTPENPSPDHVVVSAAGRAQAIALTAGRGRVVALGEAAMLTAQVAPKGFRFGMNLPGIDNRQLALNIMHWLSGLNK